MPVKTPITKEILLLTRVKKGYFINKIGKFLKKSATPLVNSTK